MVTKRRAESASQGTGDMTAELNRGQGELVWYTRSPSRRVAGLWVICLGDGVGMELGSAHGRSACRGASDVGTIPKPPNLDISDENLTRPFDERQSTFARACPGTEQRTADPFMISIVLIISTHHLSLVVLYPF